MQNLAKSFEAGRRIFLIRHGELNQINHAHLCIGESSLGISESAEMEAMKLGRYLQGSDIKDIFCSPYRRCIETAENFIQGYGRVNLHIISEFREIDTGLWNGKSFDEIQSSDPIHYARRGRNIGYIRIPGGESFYEAGKRFQSMLGYISRMYTSNIAVVSHSGVIRSYISLLQGRSLNDLFQIPQPYLGTSIIEGDKVLCMGHKPLELLNSSEIQKIYEEQKLPYQVVEHMKSVAKFGLELLDKVDQNDTLFCRELLEKGALLHDICRLKENHAGEAELYLKKRGFPELASIIGQHHDGNIAIGSSLTEADLLFYADKRVDGTKVVSLHERFEKSLSKCTSKIAERKHRQQRERAKKIEEVLEEIYEINKNDRCSWSGALP